MTHEIGRELRFSTVEGALDNGRCRGVEDPGSGRRPRARQVLVPPGARSLLAVAGTGAPVATAELAAAVSNAGGLGVMGGVAYSSDVLRAEIRKIRSLTDKPFGVDLLLAPNFLVPRRSGASAPGPRAGNLPRAHVEAIERIAASLGIELKQAPPEAGGMADWVKPGQSWAGSQIEVLLEEEVPVFASGLGTPGAFAEALHANGTTILSLVGTVKAARQVAADGADYVVAQGFPRDSRVFRSLVRRGQEDDGCPEDVGREIFFCLSGEKRFNPQQCCGGYDGAQAGEIHPRLSACR